MALSYNLGYQQSISVHPTRRQNFAGKPYSNFPNIWEWLIQVMKGLSWANMTEARGAPFETTQQCVRVDLFNPMWYIMEPTLQYLNIFLSGLTKTNFLNRPAVQSTWWATWRLPGCFALHCKTRCQIWCTIELHRDAILKVPSEW